MSTIVDVSRDLTEIETLARRLHHQADRLRPANQRLPNRPPSTKEHTMTEHLTDAEGAAWDALHDDTDIICVCDGCNYYSPSYDLYGKCSLAAHVEAIVAGREQALREQIAHDIEACKATDFLDVDAIRAPMAAYAKAARIARGAR